MCLASSSLTTYWIFIKEEFEAHLELKCKDSYLNTWAAAAAADDDAP